MSHESCIGLEHFLSDYMPKEWVSLSFTQKQNKNRYEYQKNIDYGVSRAADVGNNCLQFIIDIGETFGLQSQQYKAACDYLLATIYYLLRCELGHKIDVYWMKNTPEHIKPIYYQVIQTAQYILDALANMSLYKSYENIQEENLIKTLIKIRDRELNKKGSIFKKIFG